MTDPSLRAPGGLAVKAPGGITYEPGERALAIGRPFAWWTFQIACGLVLVIAAAVAAGQQQAILSLIALAAAVVVTLWSFVRYVQWSSRVWVLTDRRVIARAGILNRTQVAILLERVQDVSLSKPFPASLIADYGVLRLETAGVHSEERITEGLREIAITGASRFYAALTAAQTPGR